jgi:hypothetical protein
MVRDTTNRDGAVIEFSVDSWRTFAATVKNGSAA